MILSKWYQYSICKLDWWPVLPMESTIDFYQLCLSKQLLFWKSCSWIKLCHLSYSFSVVADSCLSSSRSAVQLPLTVMYTTSSSLTNSWQTFYYTWVVLPPGCNFTSCLLNGLGQKYVDNLFDIPVPSSAALLTLMDLGMAPLLSSAYASSSFHLILQVSFLHFSSQTLIVFILSSSDLDLISHPKRVWHLWWSVR